jgi:hypothetical protein
MMHATVAVAVHDHVHLAGAGHAVIRVRAVDAEIRELPNARTHFVLHESLGIRIGVELFLQLLHGKEGPDAIRDYVAWTLRATQALAIKVVNPGGIAAFIRERTPAAV